MNGLYIWVEGVDDELFFNQVLKPVFRRRYEWVKLRTYAREPAIKMNKFLQSIRAMNADCLWVADQDPFSCVTQRRERVLETYQACQIGRLQIVVQEIESWFMAGVAETTRQELKLPYLQHTNNLTKEQFNRFLPNALISRLNFMTQMLTDYSLPLALQRNHSLAYFARRHNLLDEITE